MTQNTEREDKIQAVFNEAVETAKVTLPWYVRVGFPENSDAATVTITFYGVKGPFDVTFFVKPDDGIIAKRPDGRLIAGVGNLYDDNVADAAAHIMKAVADEQA